MMRSGNGVLEPSICSKAKSTSVYSWRERERDKNWTDAMWCDGRRMWMTREETRKRGKDANLRRTRKSFWFLPPPSLPSLHSCQFKSKLSSLLVTHISLKPTLSFTLQLSSSSIDWQPKTCFPFLFRSVRLQTELRKVTFTDPRKDQMSFLILGKSPWFDNTATRLETGEIESNISLPLIGRFCFLRGMVMKRKKDGDMEWTGVTIQMSKVVVEETWWNEVTWEWMEESHLEFIFLLLLTRIDVWVMFARQFFFLGILQSLTRCLPMSVTMWSKEEQRDESSRSRRRERERGEEQVFDLLARLLLFQLRLEYAYLSFVPHTQLLLVSPPSSPVLTVHQSFSRFLSLVTTTAFVRFVHNLPSSGIGTQATRPLNLADN